MGFLVFGTALILSIIFSLLMNFMLKEKCPVCGSRDTYYLESNKFLNKHKCRNCDLEFFI